MNKRKLVLMIIASMLASCIVVSAGLPAANATISYPPTAPDLVDVDMGRSIAYGAWSELPVFPTPYEIHAAFDWVWSNPSYTYKTTITWDYPESLGGPHPIRTVTEYVKPQAAGAPYIYTVYIFLDVEAGFIDVPTISFGSSGSYAVNKEAYYYDDNTPDIVWEYSSSEGYTAEYESGYCDDWMATFIFTVFSWSIPTMSIHWQPNVIYGEAAVSHIAMLPYYPGSAQNALTRFNMLTPRAYRLPL